MLASNLSWKSFGGMEANIFLFHISIPCLYASSYTSPFSQVHDWLLYSRLCLLKVTWKFQRSLSVFKSFYVLIINNKVINNYGLRVIGKE